MGETGGGALATFTILNKLMLEMNDPRAAWLRKQHWNDQPSSLFDLFNPKSSIEPALPRAVSYHFRSLDWVIMRSDFTDPEKVLIACKSGANDDPHHGHLDVGHFNLFWRGDEFIADSGTGHYGERDFAEERWENPIVSSLGHNVVHVNGELQIPCKLKNKPWDMSISGEVLEFRTGDDMDYTLMDASNAYPREELKGWRRHIILDKPVKSIILDEVWCEGGSEIAVRFLSIAMPRIEEGYVLLEHERGTMALIPVMNGPFTFRPGDKPGLRHEYFDTIKYAQNDKTTIGTLIFPVQNKSVAGAIASSANLTEDTSGNISLSFTKDGKTHYYFYKTGKNGLVFDNKKED
jgi:hypothetical protein